MNVCLISEFEVGRGHGTGAQLELLFANQSNYHHFHWMKHHSSSISKSLYLYDGYSNFKHFNTAVRSFQKLLHISWWGWRTGHLEIREAKLKRFFKRTKLSFDVSYIVVGTNENAAKASSIARVVGRPYVVHLMDLWDPDIDLSGSDKHLRILLERASSIIALTPTLGDRARQLAPLVRVVEIPIGQPASPFVASCPLEGGTIRVVMVGRPYPSGEKALVEAWPRLKSSIPGLELVYYGPHFRSLEPTLQGIAVNGGHFDSSQDDRYRQRLADAHLAYLTGPGELDCLGKYSFPSRCVDYLMAGLPTIGYVAPGSATQRMLDPLVPSCVQLPQTAERITDAFHNWATSTARWQTASLLARDYALKHFSIDLVRKHVFSELAATASGILL